ncbi:hypothetical protein IG631_09059 [Alternaria alternata]|nr:hypothetical protein IG631_09059 [Alternaria alternata]
MRSRRGDRCRQAQINGWIGSERMPTWINEQRHPTSLSPQELDFPSVVFERSRLYVWIEIVPIDIAQVLGVIISVLAANFLRIPTLMNNLLEKFVVAQVARIPKLVDALKKFVSGDLDTDVLAGFLVKEDGQKGTVLI